MQYSRPSSQSESCEDSSMEMQPMDHEAMRSNTKDNDASSVSASESCHSSGGRSKTDDPRQGVCNKDITGVNINKGTDPNYLCQWTCVDGSSVQFGTASQSKFECTGDNEINLLPGQTYADCLVSCKATNANDGDCTKACNYVAAGALDAGQARCLQDGTGVVTSTGYGAQPKELNSLSAGDIVGIIVGISLYCCCCVCGPLMQKKRQS